jgi:hypothetical protein
MPSASRGRAYRVLLLPIALAGLALTAVLAAQESATAPAADKPPDADKGPAESHITIALGSRRQTVDGNPQRYWQYVTPPSGTHIASIEVDHPLNDEGLVFGAKAYDLLEPSAGGVGYLYEVDEGIRVDTRYRRSQFYQGFYAGADHLTRTDWRTDLRWRATPKDHLMGGYSTVRVRSADEGWRRESWRAAYTREMGSLDAYASMNIEQFSFIDGSPCLSGDATTWSLGFGPSRDAHTLIAGNVSGTNTNLGGNARSPRETFVSLSGFRQITNDLTLSGDLKCWELEDSIARTAYAKRERLAAIEGEYIGLPKTVIRAGLETADVDYVNGRQSQVLQPSVNTGTVNVRIRPRKDVKLQIELSRRRVDARPLAYDVGGYPVTTLIYSQADMLRFRGSWTPTFAPIGLTMGYQADQRESVDRGLSNEIITRDLSAWWSVTDDVTATLSLLNQSYGLIGAGNPTPFVSSARSWSLGAAWHISDRTNFETSFTRADSFGGIELGQRTWSASLEHKWDEHTVRLGLTLDDLNDYNGTLLGYDADLWYAEFSTRLP